MRNRLRLLVLGAILVVGIGTASFALPNFLRPVLEPRKANRQNPTSPLDDAGLRFSGGLRRNPLCRFLQAGGDGLQVGSNGRSAGFARGGGIEADHEYG